ncbi:MAG TPA: hypothetical protein VHU40_09490 [Polyangia bacterium]|nr:hypothetical protein [Polyangia bacterium]
MDKMIEVRYAGAVVGRTTVVRELDTRGLFLGITEPLPVGTPVTLKIGDDTVDGKVSSVSESQELARAGMRVRFLDPGAATLFGTPGEAAPEAEPPPAKVAPVPEAVPGSASAPIASGPRRIVVDASTEAAVPEPSATADASTAAEAGDAGGGAAPSEPAGRPGDHKKNKRNKRR